MCHAVNLFFEARGEQSPLGRRLVLDVVVNRRESNLFAPDTICEVVMEKNAFHWYTLHKEYLPKDPLLWGDYIHELYGDSKLEMDAWEGILRLAKAHYFYRRIDYSYGADYYMTVDLFIERGKVPFPKTIPVTVVGNHIFFKSCEENPQCASF